MGVRAALALVLALSLAWPAAARDGAQAGAEIVPVPRPRPVSLTFDTAPALCGLIALAAEKHGLPPDFFARLIWKESRFDIRAVSPVGAQGVAQFMPGTARLRGLENPWDPRQAIPASASFLADLRAQFGNLGLAAAAYNGGPDRVADWLAHKGGLPWETIDYVLSITHRPVEWFRDRGREVEHRPLEKGLDFLEACARLPVIATRAMGPGAKRNPWGVQIAAGITQSAAQRAFNRAQGQLASIVGGRDAIIVRSGLVSGREAYSARVGAGSRSEAMQLCQRIRRAGGNCVVRRN
jgi:soluble lytic murein transglycosylase-like protein